MQKLLNGYTATTSRTDVLYQKKLTLNDLPHGSAIVQQMATLAEQYQPDYDEIRRSLQDNTITLTGIKKGPAAVPGYPDTLRYFQTLFLPPQDSRIRQACADLVMFQEEAFEPVQVHLNFHVYRSPDAFVILCFEGKYGFQAISKHIQRATQPVKLYVFHTEDYHAAQEKFAGVAVVYVPTKMKQLFTS